MKTVSPSDVREPLYTFRCPKLGYDIVMIPQGVAHYFSAVQGSVTYMSMHLPPIAAEK